MATEQQKQLQEDLPSDAVRERKGGGSKKLSYVDGFYVFDEMNRIFGPGKWGYRIGDLTQAIAPTEKKTDNGVRMTTSYVAQVSVHADFEDGTIWYTEDVGYGSGIDRDAGAAVESAVKEAVTDGVKRCCRALGRRMGLALYDKQQRYVGGEAEEETPAPKKAPRKRKPLEEGSMLPPSDAPILEALAAAQSEDDLKTKVKPLIQDIKERDPKLYETLVAAYKKRKSAIERAAKKAAKEQAA